MATLNLRVRYFQDSTPADVPCREENFIRRAIHMALPVCQTALVLVDIWKNHFIESHTERATQVTREAIVPVLEAARKTGMTIVHAPSAPIAEQFSQLRRHSPPAPESSPDWPPKAFQERNGEYVSFRSPRNQPPGIRSIPDQSISPYIEVLEDDFVIATGEQLHELLRERGILHLLYAGFATNWCILDRDYAIRAMFSRGYNTILLRDATMGVEYPDTLNTLFVTEISIREVEQQYGFTASNEDLFKAVRGAVRL